MQSPSNIKAEDTAVRLLGVPNDLNDVKRPVRLYGEVVRTKAENVVTVRTQQGDIDVQYPKESPIPERGQQVGVKISAGKPPREATIRPQKAPESAQDAQRQAEGTIRAQRTPVDVTVSQAKPNVSSRLNQLQTPPSAAFESKQQSAPIPIGQNAQLQPITQKQALAYITQTAQAQTLILANIFQAIENVANLLQPITTQALQSAQIQVPETALLTPQNTSNAANLAALSSLTSGLTSPVKDSERPILAFLQDSFTSKLPNLGQIPSTAPQAAGNIAPDIQTTLPPALQNIPNLNLTGLLNTTSQTPQDLQNLISLSSDSTLSLKSGILEPLIASLEGFKSTQPIVFNDRKSETILDVLKSIKAEQNLNKALFFQSNELNNQLSSSRNLNLFVTGFTENKLPVLSFFPPHGGTPQHFVLQVPAPNAVPGNSVQVAPLPGGTQNLEALFAPLNFTSLLQGANWTSLQAIQQTIAAQSPATAQMLGQVVPNATNPAQMTPAALFFIAAARGGDLSSWLGDKAIDALKRSERGQTLLNRLNSEGGLLSRSSDGVSPDWRALALPLYHQDEMHKMALYYRQENGGEEQDKNGKNQTRFIFDLDLSQMGPVQLDGLYRPHYDTPRLDLIVRTEQHFSESMQAQMRRLYTKTIENSKLNGELSFQNQLSSWVKVDIKEHIGETVVV